MKFKPCYIKNNQLDIFPFEAGQFIVTTDTKGIYFDNIDGNRIAASSSEKKDGFVITWNEEEYRNFNYENTDTYTKQEVDNMIGGDLDEI